MFCLDKGSRKLLIFPYYKGFEEIAATARLGRKEGSRNRPVNTQTKNQPTDRQQLH